MTNLADACVTQLPHTTQPAIQAPAFIDTIDRQVALFNGLFSELQTEALRRALMQRNQPDDDVASLVRVVNGMTYETREQFICSLDPLYFINEFCQIYDNTTRTWIPFKLWDAQIQVLYTFDTQQFVIILKARQNDLTVAVGDQMSLLKHRNQLLRN